MITMAFGLNDGKSTKACGIYKNNPSFVRVLEKLSPVLPPCLYLDLASALSCSSLLFVTFVTTTLPPSYFVARPRALL